MQKPSLRDPALRKAFDAISSIARGGGMGHCIPKPTLFMSYRI